MFASHCLSGMISAFSVLDMERSMFKAVKTRFLVDSLLGRFSYIC